MPWHYVCYNCDPMGSEHEPYEQRERSCQWCGEDCCVDCIMDHERTCSRKEEEEEKDNDE